MKWLWRGAFPDNRVLSSTESEDLRKESADLREERHDDEEEVGSEHMRVIYRAGTVQVSTGLEERRSTKGGGRRGIREE